MGYVDTVGYVDGFVLRKNRNIMRDLPSYCIVIWYDAT